MADRKTNWREKLAELGGIGLVVWFVVFGLTMTGFYVLIATGFQVEGIVGESSTLFAAYAATKLTTPIRVAVTLAITPAVAAVWHRIRKRTGVVPPPEATPPEVDTRPDP